MMQYRLILAIALGMMPCATAFAARNDMDPAISALTDKLSQTLVTKGVSKVTTVDFLDLEGRPTELGRFLAEQVSDELVNRDGIVVLDRSNIRTILAEHKLTEVGLVDPKNAKMLGKFAGVDAIIIGTVTPLDNAVVLNVKAISTMSAKVVASAKAKFGRTAEIQQLQNRVAAPPSAVLSSGNDTPSSPSSAGSNPARMKDFGDLRIAVKSVRAVRMQDQNSNSSPMPMVQLAFELTNRNLNKTLIVALNGIGGNGESPGPRSQLLDSSGQSLRPSNISGLTLIRSVGGAQDSSHIIQYLRTGGHSEFAQFGRDNDWGGSFTEIAGAQSILATMAFASPRGASEAQIRSSSYQFSGELVVGEGTTERPQRCSLVNLMFDELQVAK